MAEKNSTSIAITFGTIVFLLFLILKITKTRIMATWSWWWITSPLWIPLLLVFAAFIVGLIVYLLKKEEK